MITHSAVQSSTLLIIHNDHPFSCPIIYMNYIHNAILFIDISTILDTNKLIL